MDILAHALWTNLLFADADLPTRAVAIGLSVLPDVIPFAPATLRSIFRKNGRDPETGRVRPNPTDYKFSAWAYRAYDITHSLPVWICLFGLLWWTMGSVPWSLFGWLVHVVVDIPSHRKSFFGTPFLWPFSKFRYDGISWGERWFMRLNYGALLGLYSYFIVVTFIR